MRHLARLGLGWTRFPNKGETLVARDHEYGWDIDLVGQGSLFQRIDVTHTRDGERLLVDWLARLSHADSATARQVAVLELRDMLDWRQELEAAALANQTEKLDPSPVEARRLYVPADARRAPWLLWWTIAWPLITLRAVRRRQLRMRGRPVWLLSAIVQAVLVAIGLAKCATRWTWSPPKPLRSRPITACWCCSNALRSRARLLRELQTRVAFGAASRRRTSRASHFGWDSPSCDTITCSTCWSTCSCSGISTSCTASKDSCATSARAPVNGFVRSASSKRSRRSPRWRTAIPDAHMPELAMGAQRCSAVGPGASAAGARARVPNDVSLRGPGSALVVTGSNMAGKSTLLRAVGQNIALALAGGPVIARSMRVPAVRLRASMRADDSLESGSSYFHAELAKLKRVIADAEAPPPVFFLLDELLRGTNARARHVGASRRPRASVAARSRWACAPRTTSSSQRSGRAMPRASRTCTSPTSWWMAKCASITGCVRAS